MFTPPSVRGRAATAACAMMTLLACGTPASPSAPRTYEVEVTGERFRLRVISPSQVASAEHALASGRVGVIHGELAHGDGGFNTAFRWHLRPQSVTFPDMAMEVCSGRPVSDVEADVPYWVDHLGVYCPWGARIVARIDD